MRVMARPRMGIADGSVRKWEALQPANYVRCSLLMLWSSAQPPLGYVLLQVYLCRRAGSIPASNAKCSSMPGRNVGGYDWWYLSTATPATASANINRVKGSSRRCLLPLSSTLASLFSYGLGLLSSFSHLLGSWRRPSLDERIFPT